MLAEIRRIGDRLTVAACALLVAFGCSDNVGVLPVGRTVLVTSHEVNELVVVDGTTGRIMRGISLADAVMSAALSPDASTIYLAEGLSTPGNLVALDTRSFKTRWSEAQSTPTQPRLDRWGGVQIGAYSVIAPSSDGARLYVGPAFHGDTMGIAALDASNRNLLAADFGPGPRERGLAVSGPSSVLTSATVLVVARRDYNVLPGTDWLFSLDPVTLTVEDSSGIISADASGNRTLGYPTFARDGPDVFLIGFGASAGLYKYDLSTHEVVASAHESFLDFAVSPDGTRVYQLRQGDSTSPASLLVYDASLTLLASIDLPDIGAHPPIVQDLVVSPDGSHVYISAGTSSGVFDGPIQSGQLIAIDVPAQRVIWTTALNIWAPGQVFVR